MFYDTKIGHNWHNVKPVGKHMQYKITMWKQPIYYKGYLLSRQNEKKHWKKDGTICNLIIYLYLLDQTLN